MNARRYFRRSGRLLVFAAMVIAMVGLLTAPDALGRSFAAVLATLALVAGLRRFRKATRLSPTAVVRERLGEPGKLFGVGYDIEDDAASQ